MISLRAPLSLLLLYHSLLPFASAAVASDVDWVVPDSDALTPLSASVGDSLTFTWSGRTHNVLIHPRGTCEETDAKEVAGAGASGDVTYEFTDEDVGTVTFACDVGSHCEQGQILVVTVTEGDSGFFGALTDKVTGMVTDEVTDAVTDAVKDADTDSIMDAITNTTGKNAATDAVKDATGETDAANATLLGEAESGAMTSRGDVLSIQ
eukprot:CAMPEP_0194287554 /NCGR_PEP_ID=MMETSP0169-20130528/34990_1 /TAXON_ID=218684 /ORGANISM="Corethron pennatum, Strain L29A3" /LENGTH=207 /DNA_ID=CAMNT_0039034291 /DNA_START=108 /DNA_END=728 /DNA_ORIENTATION=-